MQEFPLAFFVSFVVMSFFGLLAARARQIALTAGFNAA
jgi:hypothetical protein